MNPFSISEWISEAAFGANVPFVIVHALTSFTPAVKYVISPSNLNPPLINLFRLGSFIPSASINSCLSSSSSISISYASTFAENVTTSLLYCSAYSLTFFT